MSTVQTCIDPKEGWKLYGHFLGNLLLAIQLETDLLNRNKEDKYKYKSERAISDIRAQLVGNLYMIKRRMKLYCWHDSAAKMNEILVMVIDQDLTDPEVCKSIHAKCKECATLKPERVW